MTWPKYVCLLAYNDSMERSKPIELTGNPQERFGSLLKAVMTFPKEKVEEYRREHNPFTKAKQAKPKK